MKNKIKAGLILFAMLTTFSAAAEDVWLKRTATLRSDASVAGDIVLTVEKGAKAVLLEKNGAWAKIQLKGQTGWVALDSLNNREVKKDTNLLGGGSGAEMSTGSATKGLEPVAREYAATRRLNTAAPDQMLALRKTVTSQMLKDFVAEGNIVAPPKLPAAPEK